MSSEDTIVAIASGPNTALTVIRISGAGAHAAVAALSAVPLPAPRRMALRRLTDPQSGETIDQALAVVFCGPKSATGEDMAELHLHGSRAVAEAALAALSGLDGVRPAEPGEFTRRAFANGKLDLTQAEAVADIAAAVTPAQRRQALAQLGGGLGALYEGWRASLIAAMARFEAEIDFADEDLPTALVAEARRTIGRVHAEIGRHLDDGRRGEVIRDGFEIAIVGPPNAGKSSLLNRIAGRDAAIVAQTAGTTRDVIEVSLNLNGYRVSLLDTAGLRQDDDVCGHPIESVEREGMRRAQARADAANLVLVVLDGSVAAAADTVVARYLRRPNIVLFNKSDLGRRRSAAVAAREDVAGLAVSAKTGDGIGTLLDRLAGHVATALDRGEAPVLTKARHRRALRDCHAALGRALANDEGAPPELAAEDLRLAAAALGRLTGRVDVEDILDDVFADFCIGK